MDFAQDLSAAGGGACGWGLLVVWACCLAVLWGLLSGLLFDLLAGLWLRICGAMGLAMAHVSGHATGKREGGAAKGPMSPSGPKAESGTGRAHLRETSCAKPPRWCAGRPVSCWGCSVPGCTKVATQTTMTERI